MPFPSYYRRLFESLGSPLGKTAGVSPAALAAAEKSLGVVVPAALKAYYEVAGNERRLNQAHNRLLPPGEWRVAHQRLVFLEENQAVVYWGVSVRNPQKDDPPVSQAQNDDDLRWFQEHRRCSTFLAVMLHYQAVCGGFKHCATSSPPQDWKARLKRDWSCYGTVNRLAAYSRQNQVVCVEPDLGLLAAGKTRTDLHALVRDLGLEAN